ncbi:carboxylating nicotinate-nucleotide diphosphorylase [Planctomycetota bacterium]
MTQFSTEELKRIDLIIREAFAEDNPQGDVTCQGIFGKNSLPVTGYILARENGTVAGLPVVQRCLSFVDKQITLNILKQDGTAVHPGDTVAEISGSAEKILLAERVALNFLGHLSGIASLVRRYVDAVKEYPAKIMDTRKTLPGLRFLQKYAVRTGGGSNHRMNLSDMAMIKDNHIAICGKFNRDARLADMVKLVKATQSVPVVLEIDSPAQIEEAKTSGAEVVLLDNFNLEQLGTAVVAFRGTGIDLEASGNINLENVAAVAATGVHRISIGRITHSAPAMDFSFDIKI